MFNISFCMYSKGWPLYATHYIMYKSTNITIILSSVEHCFQIQIIVDFLPKNFSIFRWQELFHPYLHISQNLRKKLEFGKNIIIHVTSLWNCYLVGHLKKSISGFLNSQLSLKNPTLGLPKTNCVEYTNKLTTCIHCYYIIQLWKIIKIQCHLILNGT